MFERNEGQTDPRVKFFSHAEGHTLFLTGDETVLSLARRPSGVNPPIPRSTSVERSDVRLRLVGANAHAEIAGEAELPGRVNYFIGSDPSKWRSGVRTYSRVREREVYPGIDVVYYSTEQGFEFDFVVAPGADPNAIAMDLRGGDMRVENGSIALTTEAGEVRINKPLIYQAEGDGRREIAGRYVVDSGHVRFDVGRYDRHRQLVIDPSWVIYVGGPGADEVHGVAVDATSVFVTGTTASLEFTTPSAPPVKTQTGPGSKVVFVLSMTKGGNLTRNWLTYIGSGGVIGGPDVGSAIAVDVTGVFVTGSPAKPASFPNVGGFQATASGPGGFLLRLAKASGVLTYSTVIGSAVPNAVSVFGGTAFVAGFALNGLGCVAQIGQVVKDPANFGGCYPVTAGAFQEKTLVGNGGAAFVMRIDPTKMGGGASLLYSSVLDGPLGAEATGVSVDSAGRAFLVGDTISSGDTKFAVNQTGFPITATADQVTKGLNRDMFFAVMTPAGAGKADLVYSTFFGGQGTDMASGIAVDSAGNAYLTGSTDSFGANNNAPVVRYLRSFGNSGEFWKKNWFGFVKGAEQGKAIAVDAIGNAYVTGRVTNDQGFAPLCAAQDPFQPTFGMNGDAYLARFALDGTPISSTFLGGPTSDDGTAVAVDGAGLAFVGGNTASTQPSQVFPTTALNATPPGTPDGFLAEMDTTKCATNVSVTKQADVEYVEPGMSIAYTMTVKNYGPSPAQLTLTDTWGHVDYMHVVSHDCPYAENVMTCNLGTMQPNESQTIHIVLQLDAATGSQLDVVTNIATIATSIFNMGNQLAAVEIPIVKHVADLHVVKTGPAETSVKAFFTYDITVSNQGPSTATSVWLTDSLPATVLFDGSDCLDGNGNQSLPDADNHLNCYLGDLQAGVEKHVAVKVVPNEPGDLINIAQAVSLGVPNPQPTHAVSSVKTTILPGTPKNFQIQWFGATKGGFPQKMLLPSDAVAEAASPSGTEISYTATASDGSPAVCSPASGSTLPIGRNVVSCSATDPTGVVTSANLLLTVVDRRAPALVMPGAPIAQHEWTFGPDPVALAPGAIDLSIGVAWDSGFTSAPAAGIIHTGVAISSRSVCSAGDPLGGRAGVLLFNGSSESFVDFGASAGQVGTNDFAMSLWVRGPDPSAVAPASDVVLLSNRSTRGGAFYELRLTTAGAAAFELNDGATAVVAQGATSLIDGAWHHVVAQRHGADVSVYVDSMLGGSASGPNPTPFNFANGSPLLLGGGSAGGTFAIDPFRIFTRALTDGEIQRSFAAGGVDGSCGATEGVITMTATARDGAHIVFGPDPVPFGPDPVPLGPGPSPFGPDPVPFLPFAFDAVDAQPSVACTANGTALDFSQAVTFPIGETPVTCAVTDSSGNSTRSSFTVLVLAPPPPVLSVPGNITAEAIGATGAPVSYAATATGIDGTEPVACSPGSGSMFSIGTTTVACSATDSFGNTASASLLVTVQDTTPPIVSVPADITQEATGPNGAAVSFTASASDLVDGAVAVACVPASGSPFPLGTAAVKCAATDAHGNSVSASFSVSVVDTTPPAVTTSGDVTVEATSPGGAVVIFVASAADLVDGSSTPTCAPASGSTFAIGTTKVTCSATDAHQNVGSASFKVTVLSPSQIAANLQTNVAADNFQQATNLLLNVQRSITTGNTGAACNQLGSFINQVRAQSGKSLTATQAQILIGSATDARAALGCH